MAQRLSELFQAAQGAPIVWDGQTVRMMYDLVGLGASTVITISFLKTSEVRPQALRLKAKGGRFEVNDQLLEDVVLWSDSAPNPVVVHPRPLTGTPMTARMWNGWRDAAGTMQAWIGDAGLIVQESADGPIVLHCSDGFGAPTFDDFVVELSVGKA